MEWLIRILLLRTAASLWKSFTPFQTGLERWSFSAPCWRSISGNWDYTIPNAAPAFWISTQPPRKEELEDAYAKYAGQHILRDKLAENRLSPTPANQNPFTL